MLPQKVTWRLNSGFGADQGVAGGSSFSFEGNWCQMVSENGKTRRTMKENKTYFKRKKADSQRKRRRLQRKERRIYRIYLPTFISMWSVRLSANFRWYLGGSHGLVVKACNQKVVSLNPSPRYCVDILKIMILFIRLATRGKITKNKL